MTSTNPLWLPTLSYAEGDFRRMDSAFVMADGTALGSRPGIRPGDPGLAVTLTGTTINVSGGVATLYRSGQGVYRAQLAATSPGTVAAASATFTRIDLVYLRVWDTSIDGTGLRKADTVYLVGTAAASPVAPAPGPTEIYIPLATITVPNTAGGGAGAASVSSAVRPYTVAPGGILPVTSTTEPTVGGPGQVFYDADTDAFRYFKADGLTRASVLDSAGGSQVGKQTMASKSAVQQVVSSTALVNDLHLVLPVLANATYLLDAFIAYDGQYNAGDMRADWALPAGASMLWSINGPATGGTAAYASQTVLAGTPLTAGTYGTGGSYTSLNPKGTLVTAGTAGSLQFRWAQNASNGTPLTLYSTSWIRLTRMA